MSTRGFYRVDPSGQLLYAKNRIASPTGIYLTDDADQYNYPIDGHWHFFESEEDALAFFTPAETQADVIKAEVSQRINAVLKDTKTQLNMTALAAEIVARQIDGTATEQDLSMLSLLRSTRSWVQQTQQAGRDRIAGTMTPWPEPPAGIEQVVALL